MNFSGLTQWFSANIASLRNFQFSILNPVFWLFFIVLLLIVMRFWKPKKAFSFSLVVALILLATTKTEDMINKALISKYGEVLDPSILRIGAVFFIAVIWMYYAFIKSDN